MSHKICQPKKSNTLFLVALQKKPSVIGLHIKKRGKYRLWGVPVALEHGLIKPSEPSLSSLDNTLPIPPTDWARVVWFST